MIWSDIVARKIFLPADASQRLSGQHQFKKPVVPRQCLSTCRHGPFFCPWKFVIAMISYWQWHLAQNSHHSSCHVYHEVLISNPFYHFWTWIFEPRHQWWPHQICLCLVPQKPAHPIHFAALFPLSHWLFGKLIFVCCKLELCTLRVTNTILNRPHMSGHTCLYLFCFYAGIWGEREDEDWLKLIGRGAGWHCVGCVGTYDFCFAYCFFRNVNGHNFHHSILTFGENGGGFFVTRQSEALVLPLASTQVIIYLWLEF